MEYFRKAVVILSLLAVTGCHGLVIYKEPEPYTVPVSEKTMEPCPPSISLSGVRIDQVLENKIDNDVQYKECSAKNDTLRLIIESLNDEQIIKIVTPKSGSGSTSP